MLFEVYDTIRIHLFFFLTFFRGNSTFLTKATAKDDSSCRDSHFCSGSSPRSTTMLLSFGVFMPGNESFLFVSGGNFYLAFFKPKGTNKEGFDRTFVSCIGGRTCRYF